LPVAGSIKGKTTIDLVRLDRSILNHARLEHLKKMKGLYKFITVAETKTQSQALQNLIAEAQDVLQSAISDKGEFAAATRTALQDGFQFIL
jgi:S-adenosylmethionine:diacylglycerol 3-amino-3-carboxypropyl transferase